MSQFPPLAVVIPAAGVGSRMQAGQAKQYLTLHDKTILEHTVNRFLALDFVKKIYLPVSDTDQMFAQLPLASIDKVVRVPGGKERADSVLNGLKQATSDGCDWVMVHDAARPCVSEEDIRSLYQVCLDKNHPGILATPVRDTMKRSNADNGITATVDRNGLWHALTPQCSKASDLQVALEQQLQADGRVSKVITDEASALELAGYPVNLVQGSVKNIKITLPEDLELAEFYLSGINK